MKTKHLLFIFLILGSLVFNCAGQQDPFEGAFVFTAAADMRFYATEKYRTSQHFLGAVEAIHRVGAGELMISPGDTDPPADVREVISSVLGEDYLWYPSAGNHEIEDEAYMDWLRDYNRDGTTLPHVVRKGPEGCEETTYSFDVGDCHFVALNQYWDGKSDMGTDGDVIPALVEWLEKDLKETRKTHIFVFGHEPLIAMPDMDNGRIRHMGGSLDKYPKNAFAFYSVMEKYGVRAYICGHTHSTSFSNINGIWQLDVGHSRGIEENSAPEILFREINEFLQDNRSGNDSLNELLTRFYRSNMKQVKKTVFNCRLADSKYEEYKKIPDDEGLHALLDYYSRYKDEGESRKKLEEIFWDFSGYRKSSFMKFYVSDQKIKVEIFRDDGHGGSYSLRHSIVI